MNRCSAMLIETYLANYGWSYRKEGTGAWKTGFSGENQHFPLHILLSETWVCFAVQPFIKMHIEWESWPEISRLLLELNAKSTMAKLSLNTEGQIELTLDVLNQAFDYEAFCLCMGLLGFYADSFYDEILSRLDSIGFRYSDTLNLLT